MIKKTTTDIFEITNNNKQIITNKHQTFAREFNIFYSHDDHTDNEFRINKQATKFNYIRLPSSDVLNYLRNVFVYSTGI